MNVTLEKRWSHILSTFIIDVPRSIPIFVTAFRCSMRNKFCHTAYCSDIPLKHHKRFCMWYCIRYRISYHICQFQFGWIPMIISSWIVQILFLLNSFGLQFIPESSSSILDTMSLIYIWLIPIARYFLKCYSRHSSLIWWNLNFWYHQWKVCTIPCLHVGNISARAGACGHACYMAVDKLALDCAVALRPSGRVQQKFSERSCLLGGHWIY